MKSKFEIAYQLKYVGGGYNDLDGYFFNDEDHAREWLKQKYIRKNSVDTRIRVVKCKRCSDCGKEYDIKLVKEMTIDKFLNKKETHER